jgi:hypothetical protein
LLNYRFDRAIVTSGKYFDWPVSGFYVTIKLSTVSIALSFLLGLVIAIMRMSHLRPVAKRSDAPRFPLTSMGVNRKIGSSYDSREGGWRRRSATTSSAPSWT